MTGQELLSFLLELDKSELSREIKVELCDPSAFDIEIMDQYNQYYESVVINNLSIVDDSIKLSGLI